MHQSNAGMSKLLQGIFEHRRNYRKFYKFLPFLQNDMGCQMNVFA